MKVVFIGLFAALFSPVVLAAPASLTLPEAIEVLSIDGQKHKGSFFSIGDKDISLNPGQNQLIVQYDMVWDMSLRDDHERVISKPILLQMNSQSGGAYQLQLPAIHDLQQAKRYIKQPTAIVIDSQSGQAINIDFELAQSNTVTVSGNTNSVSALFNKMTSDDSQPVIVNQPTQPLTIPGEALPPPAVSAAPSARANTASAYQANQTNGDIMPLNQLRYWWKQADQTQREAFMLEVLRK